MAAGHVTPDELGHFADDAVDVERIFEPLYTTKREGLGMGLAIARTIIQAHGGQLRASNNAAGGATFTFTLPVAGHPRP